MDFLKWFRTQWDRATAAVLAVLGLVVLLLGWIGASSTPYPAEQLPYMISGGVLGIFCLGAATALFVSADLRDEWRKLNSIDATLKELAGFTTLDGIEAAPAEPAATVTDAETGPIPAVVEKPAPKRRATSRSGTRPASTRS